MNEYVCNASVDYHIPGTRMEINEQFGASVCFLYDAFAGSDKRIVMLGEQIIFSADHVKQLHSVTNVCHT